MNFENKKLLTKEEIIKGSLFGFFVGDALGVPVEFMSRETLDENKVIDMQEYGTHNQPKGTWSDDSSMVIATMESMINNNGINYIDIMNNFALWCNEGKFTPFGTMFDIGGATLKAIKKYDKVNYICGDNDINSNGNGSLMRILPVSLYLHYTDNISLDIIQNISSMTHAHIYSIVSCYIYTIFINEYLNIRNVKDAYFKTKNMMKFMFEEINIEELKSVFRRLIYEDISTLKREEIQSTGYVIDTLEACMWCILNTESYKEAVLTAVNLGSDTDTVGALTGGLAGMIYGFDAIPNEWILDLQKHSELDNLVMRFSTLL